MNPELQALIKKAIDHLKQEFGSLQTGRANTALVEELEVESYGSKMNLKSVSNISCPDARTLRIEPWDKSLIGKIEKSIQEANIGINPQNMGTFLLLPIPPMTEDRRKQMVKLVGEFGEKARISVRNARHEALRLVKLQKDNKEISEDEQKKQETKIQEEVDKANKEIDALVKNKEQDILKV